MTTIVKPETALWGTRTSSHEAVAFYGAPGWKGLADGMQWVKDGKKEDDRRLVSSPEALEEMIQAGMTLPPFGWMTLNSEVDVGLDTEGISGKKGQAVLVAIHGGGIMLNSPESLEKAYTNRMPKGEPSVLQQHITAALAGKLPNGQPVLVYTLQTLAKEDPKNLPRIYAIAVPLKELENTQLGLVKVDQLANNPFFIVSAGHSEIAKDFAKILEINGVEKYRIEHSLKKADPNKPSGRVLGAGYDYLGGLNADSYLYNGARFVGVSRRKGAEGAAPGQASLLEELAGKARDAGNGILIINTQHISPSAYQTLTAAK